MAPDRMKTINEIKRRGDNQMKASKWMMITALAAVVLWTGGARAGTLDPTNPPAPTMHTLEEIYQKLATLEQRLNADGKYVTSGDMVLIPAGSFLMGATTNVGHETITSAVPQHTVTVSAFYMDKTEVTKAKWDEVYTWATSHGYAFDNVGSGKATNHPVHTVNWYDAVKWCNARSERDGFTPCYTNNGVTFKTGTSTSVICTWSATGYRLPTEAEWEKAARGGAASRRFPWSDGNTIQHARANYYADPGSYTYDTSPTSGGHPSYSTGGYPYTSPVGSFAPNGYGLYDMAGNVLEWCWDWLLSTYYASCPAENPTGPGSGTIRLLRGGSWDWGADFARCAYRAGNPPDVEFSGMGFRCARGL